MFANIVVLLEFAALVLAIIFLQFSPEKYAKKMGFIRAFFFAVFALTALAVTSFGVEISAWVYKTALGMLIIPITIQAYRHDPSAPRKGNRRDHQETVQVRQPDHCHQAHLLDVRP